MARQPYGAGSGGVLKTAVWNLSSPNRGSSNLGSASRRLGEQDIVDLKAEYFTLDRREVHLQHIGEVETVGRDVRCTKVFGRVETGVTHASSDLRPTTRLLSGWTDRSTIMSRPKLAQTLWRMRQGRPESPAQLWMQLSNRSPISSHLPAHAGSGRSAPRSTSPATRSHPQAGSLRIASQRGFAGLPRPGACGDADRVGGRTAVATAVCWHARGGTHRANSRISCSVAVSVFQRCWPIRFLTTSSRV
jgi:hypothetical protein